MYPLTKYTSTGPGARAARARRRAFTLVEILVTLGLTSLLIAGIIPFYISNYRYLFTGEQKLLINSDIRDLTNELIETARASNFFLLYESFHEQSVAGRTVRRDANNNGTVNLNDRRKAGETGSFLVFVYYEDPYFDSRFYDGDPSTTPAITNVRVNRIVCFWTAPNRNITGETAFYTLDSDDSRSGTSWTSAWGATFPATVNTANPIENLLPPATVAWSRHAAASIVANDIRGLAEDLSFVNFQNRSVLVRLKILHGNQAKRVTNTYNFTITPRG